MSLAKKLFWAKFGKILNLVILCDTDATHMVSSIKLVTLSSLKVRGQNIPFIFVAYK